MRKWVPISIACVAGISVAALVWWQHQYAPASEAFDPLTFVDTASNRPTEVLQDGYVSSRSCTACHEREYQSWHDSYHRTMTQLATPENVIGNFDHVRLKYGGKLYYLEQQDGTFFVDLPNSPEKVSREKRPLVMVTGRHHMQFYWYDSGEGRAIGKLPFVWLVPEQQWVTADATFLKPPQMQTDLSHGQWSYNCISCHTTHGQPQLDFQLRPGQSPQINGMETTVAEFGISCEACHGPGEMHAASQVKAAARPQADLATVPMVIPDELDHRLSSQVCGRCHSVTLHRTAEQQQGLMTDGPSYLPGEDLDAADDSNLVVYRQAMDAEYQRTVTAIPEDFHDTRFWPDGMTRVSGREYNGLIESPCYTHQDSSKGILSCMDCHRMHQGSSDKRPASEWADDQLKPGMRSNQACISCHDAFTEASALAAHTHHAVDSTGSLCYNCHMPYTTYGLLKGIRSHQISSPSIASTLNTGRPIACNQCHLDKTLTWTQDALQAWYGHASETLSLEQQQVAASVLWTLQGDAGQRALMAWNYSWLPALSISGSDWIVPHLTVLMNDPYEAVRIIAMRSITTLPGFTDVPINHNLDHKEREQLVKRLINRWRDRPSHAAIPELLLLENRQIDRKRFAQLLDQRDQRPVTLNE